MDEQHKTTQTGMIISPAEVYQKILKLAKDEKYHTVVLTFTQVQVLGGDEVLMNLERGKFLLASKFSTYWLVTPNPEPGSGDISYAEGHGDAVAFYHDIRGSKKETEGDDMENITLTCKRLAVRDKDHRWQWFGPPVHFTLQGGFEHPLKWGTSYAVLESMCQDLVKQYGLEYCKEHATVVEAPSEHAYELIDMEIL